MVYLILGLGFQQVKTCFSDRIEKPKVAICPNCGEISLYVTKLDKIVRKE